MRLVLALGLLALLTFLGYAKSYALSARGSALSAFAEEVPLLLMRMDYESLPLGRLAEAMGGRGTLLSPFWAGFGEGLAEKGPEGAWWAALTQNPPYGLTQADQALLQGLGAALASPDGDGRKQTASHILGEVARQRNLLREDLAHKGNLYGALGLLFGLAAAILVI